jgi:hypothetical protein
MRHPFPDISSVGRQFGDLCKLRVQILAATSGGPLSHMGVAGPAADVRIEVSQCHLGLLLWPNCDHHLQDAGRWLLGNQIDLL